jgi:hypothetical protein
MNPYQPPIEASTALVDHGVVEDFTFLRSFTGGYYRVLGWIGIASTVISVATVYWTDYLHVDLSFIFWFWLGSSLKRGVPAARKWAIAIFLLVTAFLLLGLFVPGMKANFGDHEFDRSHPAFFVITGLIALIFAVPGLMLFGKRGRAAFAAKSQGEQAGTGQPATRSQSESEGSDKPQPEAEGRSR